MGELWFEKRLWGGDKLFCTSVGGNGVTNGEHWSRKQLGVVGIPKSFIRKGFALCETVSLLKVLKS